METECPNCGAQWGAEEMDWGCHSCGYPNNADEDDDIDDDYGDDD